MHIVKNLEKKFSLYNNQQAAVRIAFKSIKDIFTLNFGNPLKRWFVDKKLNTLAAEKKNFLLTQEVRKIIVSQKYQDIDITDADNDLNGFVNHLDEFLREKLKEKVGKDVVNLFFNTELKLEESIEFSKFVEVASELLRKNQEKKKEIIESAKVLENISYPLTKKYFLCRYLAKAIIYKSKKESTAQENRLLLEGSKKEPENYKNEKSLCLSFLKEIDTLKSCQEESNKIIQKAEEQFSSNNKYISILLKVSNAVNKHSGKIAAVYVAYVAAMTGIRYGCDDEKDKWWYEYIAAPSTALALLQIFSSFPQILFSNTKAREINNCTLENFQSNKFTDIQFIDQNIPAFSHDMLSKVTSGIRWLSNMMLQPIDLIQNDTKDLILGLTALRLLIPAGIIEEQAKVAHFVKCELRNFFYKNIAAALVKGDKKPDNKHINRFFYLLHEQIGEDTKNKLKEVYEKLTGKQDVDFNKIISAKEKRQMSSYKRWLRITYYSTAITLLLEYQCFFARKYFTQDLVDWYEDPMFYAHTAVKFMRFGSLIASKHWANKIVKYCTSNELTDDTYFNDFFYNNVARMVLAVAPLIVYESTGDVKILSIATAIDVLTTVRSDMKCGDTISMANDFSTKKATNENLRLQNSELQKVVVEQQNPSSQRSQ
ncbi:MAG: hypothetical protein sL5_02330 [Candidatus Mesenet longicola]|uniref:Uncharacterized protein n=1 Tax=Candidatus Mesenet longicola TaxID=1892558 RepID=A0A8J3MNU2_9RICK|nr:MAG: hypothetical protein sGL2_02320 [Candidatus Mesenet longicola]GHM59240.1 MAG: hypothetical protein sL5_02330 [Candidatus Mesenet longicola]